MAAEGTMRAVMINCEQESHCYIRENCLRDAVIGKLEERMGMLESRLNEMKMSSYDCWFLVIEMID
ncbi:MAG: hypothetical protein WA364_21265 [Candidatus Nitrosopolaris sp.]